MANTPHKKWCFTLNNYTPQEEKAIQDWECAHLVYGREVGESGTPHLQGYVNFRKASRLTAMKNNFCPRIHWEPCKVDEASINYCKKDGDVFEKDSRQQGKRTDMDAIYKSAIEGKFADIARDYPSQFMRYHRGIYALRTAVNEPAPGWRQKEVLVNWGPPGTGKSRNFYDLYPDLCSMTCVNNFWSDYRGQRVVLFDDFTGSWCKRATFLQMLDGHRVRINVKGSYIWFSPEVICITSNMRPQDWYQMGPAAIMRRLTDITEFEELDDDQMSDIERQDRFEAGHGQAKNL